MARGKRGITIPGLARQYGKFRSTERRAHARLSSGCKGQAVLCQKLRPAQSARLRRPQNVGGVQALNRMQGAGPTCRNRCGRRLSK